MRTTPDRRAGSRGPRGASDPTHRLLSLVWKAASQPPVDNPVMLGLVPGAIPNCNAPLLRGTMTPDLASER